MSDDRASPLFISLEVPRSVQRLLRHVKSRKTRKQQSRIFIYELLAATVSLVTFKEELSGFDVIVLCDNVAQENCLRKNYSSNQFATQISKLFWEVCVKNSISPFTVRVPTELNYADEPSRPSAEGLFPGLAADSAVRRPTSFPNILGRRLRAVSKGRL